MSNTEDTLDLIPEAKDMKRIAKDKFLKDNTQLIEEIAQNIRNAASNGKDKVTILGVQNRALVEILNKKGYKTTQYTGGKTEFIIHLF